MQQLFEEVGGKKEFISFDEELVLNQFENNFEDFVEIYVKNNDFF